MGKSSMGGRNSPLRIGTWWRYIVPPVFAYAYLAQGLEPLAPAEAAIRLGWFAISVLGTAGFGYFLNDWTDIRQDAVAGKPNQVASLGIPLRILLPLLLLALAWGPWFFLPRNPWNMSLLGGQFLVFLLYSVPPVRLKERRLPGIVCDVLYGHALPATIALSTFYPPDRTGFYLLLGAVMPVTGLMGLRNILLHQIEDRHADRKAGVRTFVLGYGPRRALLLIHRLILPLEIVALPLMLLVLAEGWIPLLLIFAGFLIFSYFTFNFWHWPWRFRTPWQRRFLFLYFLNDFYEEWLPVAAAALLLRHDGQFAWLLAAHLLLFPGFLINLIGDTRRIYRFFNH